jgi:hypothetical protein
MGRMLIFIAGVVAGATASAVAADHAALFQVSVQVVPVGTASLAAGSQGPVLTVGTNRVLLQGDGSAVATVEY